MSTQITLSDALLGKGKDWATGAWRSLPPRAEELGWDILTQTALPLVSESSGKYHTAFNQSLGSDSFKFHEATRGTLWYNPVTTSWEHNHDYADSTRDHRLNVTSLMLAENIAFNENEFLPLPERNTKNLHYWKSLPADRNWSWSSAWSNIKPSFDIDRSPEASVKWSIEAAWRNLNADYWTNELLRSENTAICALDAVYDSMRHLHQAKDPEVIRTIANKLHRDMIAFSLWGKDTLNSDRTHPNKVAKMFDELSKEMQENYILIVLATLSGISDFMRTSSSNVAVKAA